MQRCGCDVTAMFIFCRYYGGFGDRNDYLGTDYGSCLSRGVQQILRRSQRQRRNGDLLLQTWKPEWRLKWWCQERGRCIRHAYVIDNEVWRSLKVKWCSKWMNECWNNCPCISLSFLRWHVLTFSLSPVQLALPWLTGRQKTTTKLLILIRASVFTWFKL